MAHRNRIAALLGVTALLIGGIATAAPASASHAAKKPVETLLFANGRTVTTSTGARLVVEVGADGFSSGPSDDADVVLAQGHESHDWSFPIRRSSFGFNVRSGRGSVVTGTQLGKFGRMTLRLSRRSPTRTKTCASGNFSQKTQVTVTTSLSFVPHSHAWGTVGSKAKTTTFTTRGVVEIDHGRVESGCFDGTSHVSCPAQHDWSGTPGVSSLAGGWVERHGTRHGFIDADRGMSVGNRGGFREDTIERAVPVPSFVRHGSRVRVHVSTRGAVGATGSATLQSVGKPTTQTFGCGHHTSVRQQEWTASYRNGRRPLTVSSAVGGRFRVLNSRRFASLTFLSGRRANG